MDDRLTHRPGLGDGLVDGQRAARLQSEGERFLAERSRQRGEATLAYGLVLGRMGAARRPGRLRGAKQSRPRRGLLRCGGNPSQADQRARHEQRDIPVPGVVEALHEQRRRLRQSPVQ